ncbi:MAG: hypothetical protein LBQ30_11165 [Treponema sp.]|nr:hypothetical protein [Treponema sp.]
MGTGWGRARLKPEELETCFMRWIQDLRLPIDQEVVAIDRKTIRGSVGSMSHRFPQTPNRRLLPPARIGE